MSTKNQHDLGVLDREDIRHDKPKMFNVVLVNDDYTTMEFVTSILCDVFNKSVEEAERIMLHVHEKGKGVAGTYTYDIAETKQAMAMDRAHAEEHPLRVELQPVP